MQHFARRANTESNGTGTARTSDGQPQENAEKLTPEQRAALQNLRRQRLEKRLLQLRKKKENGTLSAKEEKQLQELEKFEQHHTKLILKPADSNGVQKTSEPKK